jgi:hypothetical protein
MATALIATVVSSIICPRPLYSSLAEQFLSHGQSNQELSKIGESTPRRNS